MITEGVLTWVIGGAATLAVGAVTSALKIGQTYGKMISELEKNDDEKARFIKASEKLEMLGEMRVTLEFIKNIVVEIPRMKSDIGNLKTKVGELEAGQAAYRRALESIHEFKSGE